MLSAAPQGVNVPFGGSAAPRPSCGAPQGRAGKASLMTDADVADAEAPPRRITRTAQRPRRHFHEPQTETLDAGERSALKVDEHDRTTMFSGSYG